MRGRPASEVVGRFSEVMREKLMKMCASDESICSDVGVLMLRGREAMNDLEMMQWLAPGEDPRARSVWKLSVRNKCADVACIAMMISDIVEKS